MYCFEFENDNNRNVKFIKFLRTNNISSRMPYFSNIIYHNPDWSCRIICKIDDDIWKKIFRVNNFYADDKVMCKIKEYATIEEMEIEPKRHFFNGHELFPIDEDVRSFLPNLLVPKKSNEQRMYEIESQQKMLESFVGSDYKHDFKMEKV